MDTNAEGKLGPNDEKVLIGAVMAGQIDFYRPTENCMYWSSYRFQFSKILNWIMGMDTKIPKPLDVTIETAMFGLSTKDYDDRCMELSPVLPTGIMYHLVASWLGFDVEKEMKFFKSGSGLPCFSYKFSLVGSGFLKSLMGGLKDVVGTMIDVMLMACRPIPIVKYICKAAASVVRRLFNLLIDALLFAFSFHWFKVDVPDLTKILTGGAWPSFSLKFEMLQVMFDLHIDLGNCLGSFPSLFTQALKGMSSFVTQLVPGVGKWLDSMISRIKIDCPPDKDKIGMLCYTPCSHYNTNVVTYSRQGLDCWTNCPSGMRDDGAFCRKAEYGRGMGYGPLILGVNNGENGRRLSAVEKKILAANASQRRLGTVVNAPAKAASAGAPAAPDIDDVQAMMHSRVNQHEAQRDRETSQFKESLQSKFDPFAAAERSGKSIERGGKEATSKVERRGKESASKVERRGKEAAGKFERGAKELERATKEGMVKANAKKWKSCRASSGGGKYGCEQWGLVVYPKCKPGWHDFGCCICRGNTPDCSGMGLGGRFDVSCAKKVKLGQPSVMDFVLK